MKHIESIGIKAFAVIVFVATLYWMTYGTMTLILTSTFEWSWRTAALVWFLIGTWTLSIFVLLAARDAWGYADDLRLQRWREGSTLEKLIRIRNRAGVVFGLWTLQLPTLYFIAQSEDAPGLLLFAITLLAVPTAVALFAMILLKTTRFDESVQRMKSADSGAF